MATNNSVNYVPTQYNVITGGASGLINNVAPSATSGVPLISQGSSSQPVFGTAVVAGGGTGNPTQAAYSLVCGGTTTTGAFQAVSDVATGSVLVSGGTTALPAFSATPTVTSITFGAGSALSNYVQAGSWTPGIAFGGGTTGITYSFQVGEYTRIGNIVFFTCVVALSSKGSSTGTATITGLPVTVNGSANGTGAISYADNITLTATYTSAFYSPVASSTTLELDQFSFASGNAVLTNTNFANNTNLQFNGFYFTS